MRDVTARGLANSVSLLLGSPEFDRIRLFLIADASQGRGESDEIIKYVGDEIRSHLIEHRKAIAIANQPK